MVLKKSILLASSSLLTVAALSAPEASADSRQARYLPACSSDTSVNQIMEPKNLPDFESPSSAGAIRNSSDGTQGGTPLQADVSANFAGGDAPATDPRIGGGREIKYAR